MQPDDVSLATDLEDIERVQQHFGLEAATLLGHSWGTVLAYLRFFMTEVPYRTSYSDVVVTWSLSAKCAAAIRR